MINLKNTLEFSHAKRLPLIEWNLRFLGANIQTVPNKWTMTKESHHAFEVLIILEGNQETLIADQQYELKSGDILLIPPGLFHTNTAISENGLTFFCAHFDVEDPSIRMDMLKYCDLLYTSHSLFHESLLDVLLKLVCLVEDSQTISTKFKLKIQMILLELLEVFTDIIVHNQEKSLDESSITTKHAKEIADAINNNFRNYCLQIHQNPDYELRIQPIIASLGLSPNDGLEIFQKVYHMSPRKYLSELKLQEAKTLILQSNISLKEIANRLGYKNLSHFSRQFKRWTGVCPTEFQKNSMS